MGDGLFHHFGRLENEGQDQFPRAKLVTDLFHGGEQDGVEQLDGGCVPGGAGLPVPTIDYFIDIRFDALFVAVDDAPVQALFGRHALGGVGLQGRLVIGAYGLIMFDVTL
jgi:hypothetical protein